MSIIQPQAANDYLDSDVNGRFSAESDGGGTSGDQQVLAGGLAGGNGSWSDEIGESPLLGRADGPLVLESGSSSKAYYSLLSDAEEMELPRRRWRLKSHPFGEPLPNGQHIHLGAKDALSEEHRRSASRASHRSLDELLLLKDDPIQVPAIANLRDQGRRSPEGFAFALIRYPLLLIIGTILSVELFFYFLVRQWVNVHEMLFVWRGKKLRLRGKMDVAKSYDEWKVAALEMDAYMKADAWKKQDASPYYDYRLIQRMSRLLNTFRGADGAASANIQASSANQREEILIRKLKRVLLEGAIKSNLGGVENVSLYSKSYHGTKQVVEDYVMEVRQAIAKIYESNLLTLEEKAKFFKKAAKLYGRSALCLSGGATFGYFHLGVIKALFEHDRLPSVITGTSAGSLIAAFVCVRTDEELKRDLTPDLYQRFTACDASWSEMVKNMWKTGAAFDPEKWYLKMEWIAQGDTTFLEAYQHTGRVLNITVVSEEEFSPSKLLNYKTTPDVLISSAVLASSAIPGLLPSIELKRKLPDGKVVPYIEEGRRWRDGSLLVDIPLVSLHQMFRVNYTIVSQVNPHVILFFFENQGSSGSPTAHRRGQGWRGGFIASTLECYLKLDLKKWLRVLRDLQLIPKFLAQDWSFVFLQKFEGSITITPGAGISDYIHIFTDPSRERMARYIKSGEHSTWPKLHMVSNRLRIEHLIERCRERIHSDSQAKASPQRQR